ncbi:2-hydroxyacid dehydrogenase [Nitratireductor sp. CAU 1489]|uniref:2-hydroxyacid dehydrogenase n=1 Tax=Nitratireductor arenosus TaxID=2682096 RepID=A0A844QD20_9HYPH|nr:2-hydroxyacid dehydrogenase [Nitratireductor arenosus]MVA95910.1 2-hydroxyacid dehydrogenase [Nitratireductor arenosus]
MRDVSILVPGKLHEHAAKRISEEFRLVPLQAADPVLLAGRDASAIRGIAAMTTIDAAFIDALPKLEIIANFGVGYDAVDAGHAASKNIMVTNTPDVLNEEVADTAVGLLLNTVREFARAEAYLRAGRWAREGGYPLTASTLRGRRVGIFGLGRIGQAIARRLEAFGLPIAYHNRRPVADVSYAYHDSLRGLAEAVDVLVSVAPGGAQTHKIVNAEIFEALGPDGIFLNIGRGSTVDEEALIAALAAGTIRAAGLDVFSDEPHVPRALLELDNATLLPHVGSASRATREAMADLVVDNLIAWFDEGRVLTPVPETAGLAAVRTG